MKKILTFFLIMSMIISLTACNKTEAARAVIKSINSIEEVTLSSKESIYGIETAYNALSEEEKKTIKNYDKLQEAKEQIRVLENEHRINQIGKYVAQLNDITNTNDFNDLISKIERLSNDVDEDYKQALNDTNVTQQLTKAIKDYINRKLDEGYPSSASNILNSYKNYFDDSEKLEFLGEIGILECVNDAVSDLEKINYNISFDIQNIDVNYINGESSKNYVNGNNSVEGGDCFKVCVK